jgi:integrase
MKAKPIVYPPENPDMLRGTIVDWKFRNKPTTDRERYVIRFTLTFSDGSTLNKQRGGFKSERDAIQERDRIIAGLIDHTYVAVVVTVQDFFDHWLYYHMIRENNITYNTFTSYRTVIYKHIIPKIGNMRLKDVTHEIIYSVLDNGYSDAMLNTFYSVFGASFRYARKMQLISNNCAPLAIKNMRAVRKKLQKNLNAIESIEKKPKEMEAKCRSLSPTQLYDLLLITKERYPDFYLPLLLAGATGCRISELIAIRFGDVDYQTMQIHINGQLGRPIDISGIAPGNIGKQRLNTKSRAGNRSIPVPDYVLDEIIVARERYKRKFGIVDDYEVNDGYLWHRDTGKPHNKYDYKEPFSELKKACGIPDEFRWHDFRHTFATILANNHVNLKELSTILGHTKGELTFSVYVDHSQEVYEGVPAYFEMLDRITPFKATARTIKLKEPEVISLNKYIKFLEDVAGSIANDLGCDEKKEVLARVK